MLNQKEQPRWNSPIAFLMAMIGAAVGLGNIWRFSYVLYSNGGGSFFIPYLCAILLMGVPFLILEYGVGYYFKDSFANILEKVKPKLEIVGWILALFVFLVCCYYLVIIAWDVVYLVGSPLQAWGTNPEGFFANYVGGGSDLSGLGNFIIPTVIALIAVWVILWYISHKSVDEGIGRFSKVLIPLLFLIMAIIVIYALTLPGAYLGIETLLTPNWSTLGDVDIWLAAFAQIVFSLSMGQAIATTYASYLDKNAKLNDYVLTVVASNCGFEVFVSFGVFSILGFMSLTTGMPITDLVAQGTSLVFIVFPTIFNVMGVAGQIIGPLLFIAIFFAGITSGLGYFEPLLKSVSDKLGMSRERTTTILCIIGFFISLCFATEVGSYLVSIVDGFVNEFGILFLIAVQCIIFGWISGIDHLIGVVNNNSRYKVGKLWKINIKYILPIVLLLMWGYGVIELFASISAFELAVDLIIIFGILIVAVIFTKYKPKSETLVEN